jgi:glutamyl-Q tRNA(Asp) synthetase
MPTSFYRGRFAPSPTGPLHFGSLVAAVGSYLDARAHGGEWLLRMEDLDTPRNMPGAADDILRALEIFGFEWDGEVTYQSTRKNLYVQALEMLREQNRIYPCGCSRKEIADSSLSILGVEGPVYPGTCRNGLPAGREARAWRVQLDKKLIKFNDLCYGEIPQQIDQAVGDFVLLRADGIAAYQLAVVVDDAAQGITHVVRGADLLASTPRQIFLQQLLQLTTPHYLHLPVVLHNDGKKLSKQNGATALDSRQPMPALLAALKFLGQPRPNAADNLDELWLWAVTHWSRETIPRSS